MKTWKKGNPFTRVQVDRVIRAFTPYEPGEGPQTQYSGLRPKGWGESTNIPKVATKTGMLRTFKGHSLLENASQ